MTTLKDPEPVIRGMKEQSLRRLVWTGLGLIILLTVVSQALSAHFGHGLDAFLIFVLLFPMVGAVIASRQPEHTMGWLMLGIGGAAALAALLELYALTALRVSPGSLPLPGIALALSGGLWVPFIGIVGTFFILLFPDGHLPSPRWRPWAWFCATSMVLVYTLLTLIPGHFKDQGYPGVRNPLGIEAFRPITGLLVASVFLIPIAIVGCAVAVIRRFRRSRGQERLQMKWFAASAGVLAAGYLFAMVSDIPFALLGKPKPHWITLISNLAILPFVLIPIAVGIAILKYRLYDIDVVIKKTLVFGVLAAFITFVYVSIVVGIGEAVGSGGKPNLTLSIIATAVVAIAFQPVRERVQHFANRLVYGHRATPYEILSRFSDKVAETYATEDVLPKMARTVAEGTGAAHAEVWLRSQGELRSAAAWPDDLGRNSQALPLSDGQLPSFDGAEKAIPVRHQGELLGALTVTKPPGDSLTPAEDKLLLDLASQAGLVLRNVGLTSELLARLEELKASRQRLVAAQDHERRRLERDLHDGAQQHLVALKTRLALAQRLTDRDPGKAEQLIANLEQEADEALDTLRDLARGIYPPVLADQGLDAALRAQASKSPLDVDVQAEDIARYAQDIEAAIYFCCLEALQNVAKYANANHATITLHQRAGKVTFSVIDDGVGFDPASTAKGSGTQNMADRLAVMGGTLTVASTPGAGTAVSGSLPAKTLEPA
jgi:signal transduction histidine kinase